MTARLVDLKSFGDSRGNLTVGGFLDEVPFVPNRFFYVSNVPAGEIRGVHAHRECHQFLLCINGRVKALTDDGTTTELFSLREGEAGLYLPPMMWGTQYDFQPGTVLLVFASHRYDEAEYITNYEDFVVLKKGSRLQ